MNIYFLICESCYLVASIIQNDKGVEKCPVNGCKGKNRNIRNNGLKIMAWIMSEFPSLSFNLKESVALSDIS